MQSAHNYTVAGREGASAVGGQSLTESDSQDRLCARNTEFGYCNICIDGIDGHDGEYYVQMLWCVWPLILLNLL